MLPLHSDHDRAWLHAVADEGQLAVDVLETPTSLVIRSAIAGVKEEALDINVSEDMVTIRGTREAPAISSEATLHYGECFWGPFSRSVILPSKVRADDAQAELIDGVLLITLPKTRGDVRIRVRSASSL